MFQFTHPGKGATRGFAPSLSWVIMFQFTHPGKGATGGTTKTYAPLLFQFTHPGKGATVGLSHAQRYKKVSIHAPWEGCDRAHFVRFSLGSGFNSRTLGRVRHNECYYASLTYSFNSRTLGRVRQCGAKLRIIGRINKRNLRLGVLS